MKKRTIFTYALSAVLCLSFLGGCASSEESDGNTEESSYWETQTFDSFSGTDFVKVAESGQMQLLLNPATGTIRWMDSATGVYQDTNMSHDENITDNYG